MQAHLCVEVRVLDPEVTVNLRASQHGLLRTETGSSMTAMHIPNC